MTGRHGRPVIVGASLAGLRSAQALRRGGHDGDLVVIGDERHLPYDRPPLSEQLLDGRWTRAQLDLPVPAGLDVQWHLGPPARSLDLHARRIHLTDGLHLDYSDLVVATGARARAWPRHPPRGVHTLRTADDAAAALSAALPAADRLLVIGAGFLGGEVAAAARRRGLAVTPGSLSRPTATA
jgi:NADPH-dependent 2,4-dienoyl-CoA reductase/sulfur reductase-like enzyme